jgi:hypothetical protein
MITERELTSAIGAHSVWKNRLKEAIATGTLQSSVSVIAAGDACPFGRWLDAIAAEARTTYAHHYRQVHERHAVFHQMAARVAELAAAGDREKAEELMAFHGEFSLASAWLTEAMIEWKAAVAAVAAR